MDQAGTNRAYADSILASCRSSNAGATLVAYKVNLTTILSYKTKKAVTAYFSSEQFLHFDFAEK